MGYVSGNLLPGEQVVHSAKIHWFIYLPGLALIAAALLLIFAGLDNGIVIFAPFALIAGLLLLARAWIQRLTTELAVTNKRVIAKVGLIRRSTIELNHSKVEGMAVEQSIMGRLFGFGTIIISGTGGGKTPIPNIDSPMIFRKAAMQAGDERQASAA